MPWRERSPMDERVQFISDYRRQFFTMTELCERYGVSRKTGYALLERYEREGAAGFVARSSRPRRSPQATAAIVVDAIVATRKQHPTSDDQCRRLAVKGKVLGRADHQRRELLLRASAARDVARASRRISWPRAADTTAKWCRA